MATSTSLHADDYQYSFKFSVPVEVSNLSVYATGVELICVVYDSQGNSLAENFAGPSYSNNIGTLDSTGAFSGTLTYAVRFMNPADASKAKAYYCAIQPRNGNSRTSFKPCTSDIGYYCYTGGMTQVNGTIQ